MPTTLLASTAELIRGHQMFFCGVAAVLAIMHAALFFLQPQRRENAWCALFLGSYGILVYANFAIALHPAVADQLLWDRLFFAAIALVSLTWLLSLYAIFGVQRPWVVAGFGIAAGVLGLWAAIAPSRPLFGALLLLALLTGVVAAAELVRAWVARRDGARLLGVGMALLAAAIVYSTLRTLDWLPATNWAIFVPTYGGLCAALSLSLYLVRNYALTAARLTDKLAEVERLSASALAHEHEKQQLIAAKNAELEGLVAERTQELRTEKTKVDELLYNILPRDAADELKAHGHSKPRRHEDVTILFTDFQGFTNTVSAMPAQKLVSELNDMFNRFDDIMDRHGVQKIKTIGDAYMAAGGIPEGSPDAAARVVAAALEMVATIAERNRDAGVKWQMRLGVHTGIVVAGVMGKRRLIYDLFGDTVNIASRMESHGKPGRVNLSAYTYDLVRHQFTCEYLGKIDVKGKGEIDMYSVVAPIANAAPGSENGAASAARVRSLA